VHDGHDFLAPSDSYVVSFAHFHDHKLVAPTHRLLLGLLYYYKIEVQHLNPNGIQHIAAFIMLCEGYLGIEPHFDLWRYFFCVSLHTRREHGQPEVTMPGSTSGATGPRITSP
jgi:hypothetical protein